MHAKLSHSPAKISSYNKIHACIHVYVYRLLEKQSILLIYQFKQENYVQRLFLPLRYIMVVMWYFAHNIFVFICLG